MVDQRSLYIRIAFLSFLIICSSPLSSESFNLQTEALNASIKLKPKTVYGLQRTFSAPKIFSELSEIPAETIDRILPALEYFFIDRNLHDLILSRRGNLRRSFKSEKVYLIDMAPGSTRRTHSRDALEHTYPKPTNSYWTMLVKPLTIRDFKTKKERKFYRQLKKVGLFNSRNLLRLANPASGYRSANSQKPGAFEHLLGKQEKKDLIRASKIIGRGNRELKIGKKRIKSDLGLNLAKEYNKQFFLSSPKN